MGAAQIAIAKPTVAAATKPPQGRERSARLQEEPAGERESVTAKVHARDGEARPAPDGERHAIAARGVDGSGEALPSGLRSLFEARFRRSFAQVRLHCDRSAARAAQQLGAAAYALGRDIAFNEGYYAPHTRDGLELLAHELAHIVQAEGASDATPERASAPSTLAAFEREAEAAADLRSAAPSVQQRILQAMPLCHPIYISSHGDPGYLGAAADFYKSWGYGPIIPNMPSIEAIVADLATNQKSFDHVTIVSHANPKLIKIQFIDGGPDQVQKDDWHVDTADELVDLERHNVDKSIVDTVIEYVNKADAKALPPLAPLTDPSTRQYIWWLIEIDMADRSGYSSATRTAMMDIAKARANVYRARLASKAGKSVSTTDLDNAERAVAAQAARWKWTPADPAKEKGLLDRLKGSPSKDISRIIDQPDFLRNLAIVRTMISDKSWIELQGCNAGDDPGYLTAVQGFFGGGLKPKVTAPDWYQAFGHYAYKIMPDSEDEAKKQMADKGVAASLAYWAPQLGYKLPKKPTYDTLLDYLRKGHALPLLNTTFVLVLKDNGVTAFLEWLSKHGYRLNGAKVISKQFGIKSDIKMAIKTVRVDWLEDAINNARAVVFRPSPEYDKHIIKAP